jgi:hypothetical protein
MKQLILLLLLLLSTSIANATCTTTNSVNTNCEGLTDTNFQEACNLWVTDESTATTRFGPIGDW